MRAAEGTPGDPYLQVVPELEEDVGGHVPHDGRVGAEELARLTGVLVEHVGAVEVVERAQHETRLDGVDPQDVREVVVEPGLPQPSAAPGPPGDGHQAQDRAQEEEQGDGGRGKHVPWLANLAGRLHKGGRGLLFPSLPPRRGVSSGYGGYNGPSAAVEPVARPQQRTRRL